MKPTTNTITFDTPLATCWLKGDILCVVAKDTERTGPTTKQHYSIVSAMVKNKKVFWLLDLSICMHFSHDTRSVISRELPKVCKGMAIIVSNPCGKMLAGTFLAACSSRDIPVKQFESETSAREWLDQTRQKYQKN